MLTTEQREKITAFSKKCVEKNDAYHQFSHLEMVARTAVFLAKKEGADVGVCEAAAFLHDICKAEPGDHGTTGACKAREFLLSMGMDGAFADAVAEAIHFHDKENRARSLEGGVLWDADKLHILIPRGFITRMLPFWVMKLGEDRGIEKAIYEYNFYKERINTKAARAIIERHSKAMESIISDLGKTVDSELR
jgi:HD superfamily phosphodiesterase